MIKMSGEEEKQAVNKKRDYSDHGVTTTKHGGVMRRYLNKSSFSLGHI